MPQMPRALAEGHASLIGAAASVLFMSASIAYALALINVSAPGPTGSSPWAASSGWKPWVSNAPAPAAARPAAPDRTGDPAFAGCDAAHPAGSVDPASPDGCALPPGRTVSEARVDAARDVAPASPPEGEPKGPQPTLPAATAALAVPLAPRRPTLRRPARHAAPAEQAAVPVEHAAVAPVPPRARPQPAPLAPPRAAPRREPEVAGLITPSMLRRLSAALNLTPEQRALYLPLERQLLAIGAQQRALVSAGQDPKDAFSIGTAMSMYGVAQPFLDTLSEGQKARVRAEARNMGFGFAAAQI